MRSLLLALAVAAAIPAANAAGRSDLPDMIDAFLAEERPDANPERRAAIAGCLLSAFDGIDDAELATLLDEDDFEDSLDALVNAYPQREDIIEECEDL